jgi:hypothetical protein
MPILVPRSRSSIRAIRFAGNYGITIGRRVIRQPLDYEGYDWWPAFDDDDNATDDDEEV